MTRRSPWPTTWAAAATQSFNDSAYAGLEKAEGEFKFQKTEGEASQDEDEAAREERLRGFAEDGYNTIVGVGFAYSESVNKVAPRLPGRRVRRRRRLRPRQERQLQRRLPDVRRERGLVPRRRRGPR
ncbi:MAG: BMP family ABC transporter substrate-binding protein [Aeromicrobium erythreum]